MAIDANTTFANIASIKAAQDSAQRLRDEWEARDRAAEARATANAMLANEISKFQFEWHILDSVVE